MRPGRRSPTTAAELADARSLRRQTDALRRALADLNRQIAAAQDRL